MRGTHQSWSQTSTSAEIALQDVRLALHPMFIRFSSSANVTLFSGDLRYLQGEVLLTAKGTTLPNIIPLADMRVDLPYEPPSPSLVEKRPSVGAISQGKENRAKAAFELSWRTI
ncbi:hypothetical protein LIER_01333 [Lithospermum erythrorhizon]|uniref:Uncharacterized protein n=1 Tax=Lithospermum erythrorhizon TaxID=34254 RepID=A0AAV3NKI8_LITER